MRRLMTAALPALILLCTPFSDPQGWGLHSICWTPLRINLLIRAEALAATNLRPVAPPVQDPASERGAAPSAQDSISLEPGMPVERELSVGKSHFYKIAMTSGQYLRITVSQRGIDALVALFTPDGKKIGEVDGERMTVGLETISAIAEAAGAYRIEVRSVKKMAKTGHYEIKIEELRDATTEDKYRVAAESLYREAELLSQGTLEEKRKCIEKYQEVLELYQRAGASREEAATLNDIGWAYNSLGEAQKALEMYNEALPIRRAVGDRNGEAATLLGIARAEQKRGNLTQARQTIEQAISIVESVRASIGSQELRASFFASRQDFYESYIEVLMQMHKQNPAASFDALALAVSERARARSLLELLTEARADIRQGVDSSLIERERSLRQKLNARAAAQVSLLNRKHTPEQADAAARVRAW